MSTFSPVGSRSSNGMSVRVCVCTEWTWSMHYVGIYIHISVHSVLCQAHTHPQTIWGQRIDGAKSGLPDSSGKTGTYLSLATFCQCSPLWPGLFRSFFVCFGLANRVGTASSFSRALYLSPNWMLSSVRSVKHFFFRNASSTADRGVWVPTTSLWLHPIDPLLLATVVFWLHFSKETHKKENSDSFVSFPQQPTAAHLLGMLHFRFVVAEPCGSVVLLWRHGGHVTETRDFQLQTTQLVKALCMVSVT